ncbi:MAG: lipid-A-disaccharide synthase [Acidobacteria bacterium]|nr:lipid-A-disaccharide synthase [Acidobacteriota bacterium]
MLSVVARSVVARDSWPAGRRRRCAASHPDAHRRGPRRDADSVRRSRDLSYRAAGLRGRRAWPAPHRGGLRRRPGGGWRAECLHGSCAQRRPARARSARDRHQDQSAARLQPADSSRHLSPRLLLSCGEPSGDLYAGQLTRELRALCPDLAIAGLGGPQFAAAGGVLLEDYRGSAVTGVMAPLAKIPRLIGTLARLTAFARRERPDALVVVDFQFFNARLAWRVKKLGIPVVYYIGPQIWAWRAWRLKAMRQVASRVLLIFPFEPAIYEKGGVPAQFVGHPLVDLAHPSASRDEFLGRLGLSASAPTVAVLPGSRPDEVRRILPDLMAATARIRARVGDAQFVVARAPRLSDELFAPVLPPAVVVEGETDAVLASADVALTASGTATIQAALHDTPMVVVYRLPVLEYLIGRRLLTIDTFGMVNLIAGERIVPEFIQHAFTPAAVADEAVSMLTDAARVARIRQGLALVRARLGGPGASRRAAEAILEIVGGRTA